MDLITAGVFRAYSTWVSETIHDENPDSEKAKKLKATRQFVSQLLVGRSVDSARIGVIYIDYIVVCVAEPAPRSIVRLLLPLSGCPGCAVCCVWKGSLTQAAACLCLIQFSIHQTCILILAKNCTGSSLYQAYKFRTSLILWLSCNVVHIS